MIVIDKDNKNLVIPNGLGNINRDYQEGYEAGYQESFDEGKAEGRAEGLAEGKVIGIAEGKQIQKDLLETITITENGTYNKEDGYNQVVVDVPDLNGSYDNGYQAGKTDGYDEGYNVGKVDGYDSGYTAGEVEQKSKLTNITISENGTYTREDGYNTVVVDVPDTNGSYDEGYQAGIDYASDNANEIAAVNAIVLDATENKTYYTKYVDIPAPEFITGEFEDGTPFYDYAELTNISYDPGILSDNDTKVELWWYGDVTQRDNALFGWQSNGNFKVCVVNNGNLTNALNAEINYKGANKQNLESYVWYHIELSKQEGFKINGELIGTFESAGDVKNLPIYLNTLDGNNFANGKYGMIKINDTIIIPTPDGFLNTNTNEMLSVAYTADNSSYVFKNQVVTPIDNLIKQVNVNVKINVVDNGIKFGYSSFTSLPEWVEWEKITNYENLFYNCRQLNDISLLKKINGTSLNSTFEGCFSIKGDNIKHLDISKVSSMANTFNRTGLDYFPSLDTSNVIDFSNCFGSCNELKYVEPINTSKATNFNQMFYDFSAVKALERLPEFDCTNLTGIGQYFCYDSYKDKMDKLTDVGGWKNLKIDWTSYGLNVCRNLSYQSCINVLNGLWDFRGNGDETTTRTLKVHQNFIDLVGDEISIGTSKGWMIIA